MKNEQGRLPRLKIIKEIFQHIPVSIVLTDKNGTIEYVNPKFTEINGYTYEEALGKNPRILKDPKRTSDSYKKMWETISSGKSWRGVFRNRKKDGLLYWEDALISPVFDDSGKIVNYFAIKENITERKEMEDQLNIQARAMNDAKSSIVIVDALDPDFPAIYVNKAFEKMTGYSREEVTGKNLRFLNSLDRKQPELDRLRKAIRNNSDCQCLLKNFRKDGRMFMNDLHVAPIKNSYGDVTHFVGSSEDITDFLEIRKELEDKEARLRLGQKSANIGTWDWNIQTGISYWSEPVAKLLGYKEPKSHASFEEFISCIHPEDRAKVLEAVDRCINEGADYNVDHRCIWPDGTVIWLQESGDVYRDEDGKPLHMLGVIQDITSRVNSEKELEASREEAYRANIAKSEFLSSVSHELRTPMNAIIGFAQLLEMDAALDEDQRDSAKEIIKAGRHLLDLINEILDLSKMELGRIELSIEPADCRGLVSDSLSLISPLAKNNEIEIRTSVPENLHVMIDRARMKQVITNLLSNAVKYNNKGGYVNVDAAIKDRMVSIKVSDSGIGIHPDEIEKLFEPFNRSGVDVRISEGAGIGLPICQRLVKMMNGSISVSSTPGEGSIFTVEIPAAEISRNHDPSDDEDEAKTPYKILYIEDDRLNIILMKQIIEKVGNVKFSTSETPNEGVKLAEAETPDLVMLDLNLPGMNGFEVLEEIRKKKWGAAIPVIAVSANNSQHDVNKAIDAGFNDYLKKPLNIPRVYEIVERYINQNNNDTESRS